MGNYKFIVSMIYEYKIILGVMLIEKKNKHNINCDDKSDNLK